MINSKTILNQTLVILTCCIPMGLILGPAIADSCVVLIALIFIFLSIKYQIYHFYRHNIFKLFILFNIYLIFSSLISDNPFNSLRSTLFYFRFGFLTTAIFYLLETNERFKIYFFWSCVATILFLIPFSLEQVLLGKFNPHEFRISGIFGEELVQGSYLVRMLPLILFLKILIPLDKKFDLYFYLFFISIILLVIASGERAAIALLFMSLLITVVFWNTHLSKKLITSFVFLYVIFVLIVQNSYLNDRLVKNTKYLLLDGKENKIHAFSRGHQEHYQSAYKMFKKNIFFGVGVRNFRIECRKDEYKSIGINACTTHPHNTYVQLLAETGIIGFFFVFSTLIYFIIFFLILLKLKFINKLNVNMSLVAISTCFAINLFPLIPTGSFFNNWMSIIYYLPLAFFLYQKDKKVN